MISAIAFVDLDDTLFQTRPKCPPGLGDDQLVPMALDREGKALSFASPMQSRFIEWLAQTTLFVPVTGRSLDALRRTSLTFGWAVAAHGGVMLREDGNPCGDWRAHIAPSCEAALPQFDLISAAWRDHVGTGGDGIRMRVVEDDGLPLYLVAKHDRGHGDDSGLHGAAQALAGLVPPGWTLHVNGNNVAYIPDHLGKEAAVRRLGATLRALHPGLPTLGIGDSFSDAPFMAMCDFAMIPVGSQLAGRLTAEPAPC